MNETVDTRVVRMEFDNKQFEKNIKKTSQSLEKLKQNLDFKGVGDSVDEVRVKISALEIAAVSFIANISNRLTDLAIKMVKSLSVDNISAGWTKFGDKTTSVATMMAQKIRIAGQEITDLAKKTEVVNEQLELLNWFSDETSYSFNDMVNNVGKFTAAGQDLDVSVKAMEGIATWAALSGQNAQTASRAMYQLAQAMGKGKIQKIDWMSIQNANMDTEEFRETILGTAVALGELTKEGDQFVTKTGKKFTQSQFADFLSEGWFTSDVLVKGLNKYSAAVDEIYEISEREGITASEVIEKYGDQLDKFGVKAFKAAQEARTFADVLNSVKDAVSSKWMTTFEMIFGSEAEAVKLWTDLANELYDVFAESGNFRNDILAVWKQLGGRDDLFARGGSNQGAFWNIYDAIVSVIDTIKGAWRTIFPLSTMESLSSQIDDAARRLKDITTRIREFTERLKMSEATTFRLNKLFQGVFSALKFGLGVVRGLLYVLDPVFVMAKELAGQILDQIIYYFGKLGTTASGIGNIFTKLQSIIIKLIDSIDPEGILEQVFEFIRKIFITIANYHPIEKLVALVETLLGALNEATNLKEDLKNVIRLVSSAFNLVSKVVKQLMTLLVKLIPVITKIFGILVKFTGYIIGTASKLVGVISKLFSIIMDFLANAQLFENIKNAVIDLFTNVNKFLQPLYKIIEKIARTLGNLIKNVLLALPRILDAISKAIQNSNILQIIANVFNGLIDIIRDFINNTGKVSANVSQGLAGALGQLFKGLFAFLKSLVPVLQIIIKTLGTLLELVAKAIHKIATAILNIMTGQDLSKFLKVALVLSAIAVASVMIYWILWTIKSTILPIHTLIESITDVCDSIATKLRAGVFREMANSILKIAISLSLIAAIDKDKLIDAIATLAIIGGLMLIMIGVLSSISGSVKIIQRHSKTIGKAFIGIFDQLRENMQAMQGFMKINTITKAISSIANSLLKASIALLILSKIPESQMNKSLLAALAIMGFFSALTLIGMKVDFSKGSKTLKRSLKDMFSVIPLLLGIGASMILLTKAIGNLSDVPIEKVWNGVAAIGALMILITALARLNKALKSASLLALSVSMTSLGIALMMITSVIAVLSFIDIGRVWNGVAVITALTGLMILMARLTNAVDSLKLAVFSASLLAFGVSMEMMSVVLATLSTIDYGKVWNGVAIITVITGLIMLLSKLADTITAISFATFSVSLLAFGMAMEMMAGVVATLSAIDIGKAWNGVGIITAFLAVTALTIKLIGIFSALKFGVFAANLIVFSKAMLLLAATLVIMASADMDAIDRGRKIIQGFLAVTALATKLIGLLSAVKFSIFSASLMLFANAMLLMSGVFSILGSMDPASLWIAIGAITAFMVGLAGIAVLLKETGATLSLIGLATGMLIFASAMVPFVVALIALGSISMESLGRGLLALAASLGVLILIAAVAKPLITTIIALSAALLIAGVGMLAAGMGLTALAGGLEAIALAFTTNYEMIQTIIIGLVNMIIDALLGSIERVVDYLLDIMPKIFELIAVVIDNILMLLNEKGPAIIETVIMLVDEILKALDNHADSIFTSVFRILIKLLDKLVEYMPDIAERVFKIVLILIDKLIEYVPALVQKIFELVTVVLAEVAKNVVAFAALVAKVILILLSAAIRITIASLGALSKLFITFVSSILLVIVHTFMGLSNAVFEVFKVIIKEMLSALVEAIIYFQDVFVAIGKMAVRMILRGIIATIQAIGGWLIDLIDRIFGTNINGKLQSISNNLANEARSIVRNLEGSTDRVQSAINKAATNINKVVSMTADSANSAVKDGVGQINNAVTDSMSQLGDAMKDFGETAGTNLTQGISIGASSAYSVGSNIGNNLIEGYATETQTHSPSRVMIKMGEYLIQGLANGVTKSASIANDAISVVVSDALSMVNAIIDEQSEDDVTIKVGMDISSVEAQSARVQEIMSAVNNPSITPSGVNAAYNSRAFNRGTETKGETVNNNSSDITYNNTFNITSTEPEQSAEEIDKILQQQAMRAKLAHGS